MAEEPKKAGQEPQNPVGESSSPPTKEEGKREEAPPSVEVLKKQIEELTEKLKKEQVDKAGLIEQIKELRKRAQEAEARAGVTSSEPKREEEKDEITKKVYSVIQKEREKEIKENRVKALRIFWKKHPEFNPENDITGLRMQTLNQSLSRLNTSNSRTVEEILADYEDALKISPFAQTSASSQPVSITGREATTSSLPAKPKTAEGTRLTPEQEKLRKEKGWSVEKYLEMKAKYPKIIP
ncbi:hypothetical protein DRN43_04665 [Thermococci archaeon]|nr:MAG: hypothetical protein DRN43_04665 [Thermococci archaeon]